MKHQLYSVYGAARALERDRQTIERVVRDLVPDAHEKGQPRWRLARIVEVLNAKRSKGNADDVSHDLQAKFDDLETRYDTVRNAPTLRERRKLAPPFFRFLVEVEDAMRADAKRSGEDARIIGLRVSEHTRVYVATLRQALGWNFDETWDEFMKADPRRSHDV
jgi:hypothetical protein